MILLRNFCHQLMIIAVISLSAIMIESAASELKLVNVVFRHGDRTPDDGNEMYPNDPYLNYFFYPTGHAQLTLDGKRREYNLGRKLRKKYRNYLGSVYIPKHVVARSTNFDRTKMSLQLVLAGLFPPADVQQWNKQLDWQPIPTLYTPRVDDKLIMPCDCPEYLAEYERILDTPEVQEMMSQFEDLGQNLTKLTGKRIEKPLDFYNLYHTFMAESSLGLPLPGWVNSYFFTSSPTQGPLFNATVASYNIASKNHLLKKYAAGPLIGAMTDNMRAKQNGAKPVKIYLYGAHESNIAQLLHAFQLYEPHVPEYSSAIITELHQIDSDYYVKLVYYTGIPPLFKELTIPGCELLCPFDNFVDLTANLIPTKDEFICNKRKTQKYANVEYPAAEQGFEEHDAI